MALTLLGGYTQQKNKQPPIYKGSSVHRATPLATTHPEHNMKPTAVQPRLYKVVLDHFSSVQQGREETSGHQIRRRRRARSHRTVPSPSASGVAESGGSAASVSDSPFFPTRIPGQGRRRCPGSVPPGAGVLMPERGTALLPESLGEEEGRAGRAPPQLWQGVTARPPRPPAFHAWSAGTPPGAIPQPLACRGQKQNKLRFTGLVFPPATKSATQRRPSTPCL